MTTHSSVQPCAETPHANNSITNSDAVRRRAQSLINDRTIEAGARIWIHYALKINDPFLPELVRRADAGEPIIDDPQLLEANEELSVEEKLERLTAIICQADDKPETRAAALLVLMSTLENSEQPKVLVNHLKHLAFTRCGELNCYGMVDAQIATIESELLASTIVSR